MKIKAIDFRDRGEIPSGWVAIPKAHWNIYLKDHAEIEHIRSNLLKQYPTSLLEHLLSGLKDK
jgi:hypothetical protein